MAVENNKTKQTLTLGPHRQLLHHSFPTELLHNTSGRRGQTGNGQRGTGQLPQGYVREAEMRILAFVSLLAPPRRLFLCRRMRSESLALIWHSSHTGVAQVYIHTCVHIHDPYTRHHHQPGMFIFMVQQTLMIMCCATLLCESECRGRRWGKVT